MKLTHSVSSMLEKWTLQIQQNNYCGSSFGYNCLKIHYTNFAYIILTQEGHCQEWWKFQQPVPAASRFPPIDVRVAHSFGMQEGGHWQSHLYYCFPACKYWNPSKLKKEVMINFNYNIHVLRLGLGRLLLKPLFISN